MLASARWELLWTSVGLKAVMALSGAVLSGWVLLHMLGNLLVFGGPELINGYGGALQAGPILWIQRVIVLIAVAAHAASAWVLTTRSRGARSERYRRRLRSQETTLSARSMRWGGVFVLLFLAYHLVHIYGPLHASYVPGDIHHNLVTGLSDPLAASIYVAATIVFGLHLHHGTVSLFRSLGHARLFETGIRRAARAFTVVVTLGFLAPCVAALAGWL
jgi:succinate dehydrogenase / fumarate reductase cytochrome b subunit